MPVSGQRDVTLGVEIQTRGNERLTALATEVRRLAAEGGAAAPRYAELAAQLDRLAQQQGALTAIQETGAALAASNAEVQTAVQRATELRAAYDRQTVSVEAARAEQTRLQQALKQTTLAWTQVTEETRRLENTQRNVRELTDREALSLAQARESVIRLASAKAQLAVEAQAAGREATQAAQGYTRLASASETATREALELQNRLRGQASEMQGLGAAATRAGLDVSNLAESGAKLGQAFSHIESDLAGVAEGAAAMRLLEAASSRTEREAQALAASLTLVNRALESYVVAATEAAQAGAQDAQANRRAADAAHQLLVEEQKLTQEQRELANARNAGRQAVIDQAIKTREAAATLDQMALSMRQARVATQQAGAQIEQSFGATGVRSVAAIEAEIQQTTAALVRLQIASRNPLTGVGLADLERAAGAAAVKIERLKAEILQVQALPNAFEKLNSGITDLIQRFGAVTAAFGTVGIVARPVLEAAAALDSANRILTTVTKSSTVAGEQFQFLAGVAAKAGTSFTGLATDYAKFIASASQSGIPLRDLQGTYESVALAAGNLGLSSDQTKRALEALSQIASKGTVGMEELRQQLGDALPGVLPLLAKQLGLTQAELAKVVESGGLVAKEAIPAIGRALRGLGPANNTAVEGMIPAWERFKNVILAAGTEIVEGPIGKRVLGPIAESLSKEVGEVALAATTLSQGLELAGSKAALYAAALVQGKLGTEFLSKELEVLDDKAGEAINKVALLTGRTDAYSASALAAANASGDSLSKIVLLNQERVKAAEIASSSADKIASAAAAEFEALNGTLAKLQSGKDALEAHVRRIEGVERATGRAAKAQREETEALVSARRAVLDKIGTDEEALRQNKKLIDDYDQKITKARADEERTEALARRYAQLADAARLANEQFGDQSKLVPELTKQVIGAQRAYEAVERAFRNGKATTDDLAKAEIALGEARTKLKDATEDLTKAVDSEIKVQEASLALRRQLAQNAIQELKIKRQAAVDRGAEQEAVRLGVEIARQELELQRDSVRTSEAGLQLRREEIDAREQQMRQAGTYDVTAARQLAAERIALETTAQRNVGTQRAITLEENRTRAISGQARTMGDLSARVNENNGLLIRHGQANDRSSDAIIGNSSALGGQNRASRDAASGTREASNALSDHTRAANGDTEALRRLEAQMRANQAVRTATATQAYSIGGRDAIRGPDPIRGPTGVRLPGDTGSASLSTLTGNNVPDAWGPNAPSTYSASAQLSPPDNSGDWEFNTEMLRATGGQVRGDPRDYWRLTDAALARIGQEQQAALAQARTTDPGGFNGSAGYSSFGSAARIAAATQEDPQETYLRQYQLLTDATAASVRQGQQASPAPVPPAPPAPIPAPASASSPTQTIAITFGGQRATFQGNPASVSLLVDVLREAERQGGG